MTSSSAVVARAGEHFHPGDDADEPFGGPLDLGSRRVDAVQVVDQDVGVEERLHRFRLRGASVPFASELSW